MSALYYINYCDAIISSGNRKGEVCLEVVSPYAKYKNYCEIHAHREDPKFTKIREDFKFIKRSRSK